MRSRDSAGVGLRQQGHRGSILRSRRAIRIRIVATDSATWRCARIGSSPRTEAFGYGSDLERESEERNARGGKKTPLDGQEAVCGYAECGVVMESSPASAFVVVQAELVLQLLVVSFDPPAKLDDLDQRGERRVGRHRREPVLCRFLLPSGPLDQEPLFGARFSRPVIAVSRTNSEGA